MPADTQPSARRPQLKDRSSSAVSLPRGSPSGLQSTSHKGSSTRLHRAHVVGGNKLGHGRVPSTGKGLHKSSKVTGQRHEEARPQKKARSPSTSPTAAQVKRNSSNFSLTKAGSKVNIRKNKSDVSIKRHASGQKGAKGPKSERGQVHFDIGDEEPEMEGKFGKGISDEDEQEEEWTEASNSQSPAVTRRSSVAPLRPSNLEEPPSPDDPPARSPPVKLPDSPPKSPIQQGEEFGNGEAHPPPKDSPETARESDKQAIQRLMNHGKHQQATTQISSISAVITPSTQGDHAPQQGASQHVHTPSMPSDGISRFLSSKSQHMDSSASPDSTSHSQSNISGLALGNPGIQSAGDNTVSNASSLDPSATAADARKAQSAIDLTHHQLAPSNSSQRSTSPDHHHHLHHHHDGHHSKPSKHTVRSSPFDVHHSTKGSGLGRSLTQLKLDLERMKSTREAETEKAVAQRLPSPTSVPDGAVDEAQRHIQQRKDKWMSGEKMEERRRKMYESVEREYGNMRRFQDVGVKAVRRLEKRGKVNVAILSIQKDTSTRKKKTTPAPTPQQQGGSSGSFGRADSNHRGRVRFDVGRAAKDAEGRGSEDEDEDAIQEGVQGILKRMWRDFEATQEVGVGSGE